MKEPSDHEGDEVHSEITMDDTCDDMPESERARLERSKRENGVRDHYQEMTGADERETNDWNDWFVCQLWRKKNKRRGGSS